MQEGGQINKDKNKKYVCMYTTEYYFSLDLLALGALTPGPDPDPAGGSLKYYQGLHEIQSCTRTAEFFLCCCSCCPNNNMAVLAQSTESRRD